MPSRLLVRFFRDLTRHDLNTYRNAGPVFHRWLPNGEEDALKIHRPSSDVIVRMWFERRGELRGGMIQFDNKIKLTDTDTMRRQGALVAGPLYGEVSLEVSDLELEAIRTSERSNGLYAAVGKRFVRHALQQHVLRFIRVLRWTYGQYWLKIPESWDSRTLSLGAYCSEWRARWSDRGQNWAPFLPDEASYAPQLVHGRQFQGRDLLSEADWAGLKPLLISGYDPPPVAELISRSHELSDQHRRYAFVDGVAALEAALDYFLRQRRGAEERVAEAMKSFWALPLPTKLSVVALSASDAPDGIRKDLDASLEAVATRNRVVHEGFEPPAEAYSALRALLRVASRLIGGPRFRFPRSNQGNVIMSRAENWDKYDSGLA